MWSRRPGFGAKDTEATPIAAVDVGSGVRRWFLEVFVNGVPHGMHCLGGLAWRARRTVAINRLDALVVGSLGSKDG